MKLDRLLAIVMLLINRDLMQAKDLAEIFGVSVRTIYRDLDTINQAGIPLVTLQGANGGVGIMDTYRIDRNVLKDDDIVAILRALQGLETSLADEKILHVIEKIAALAPKEKAATLRKKSQQVVIDFSGWQEQDSQRNKMGIIKAAIDNYNVLSFTYTSASGEHTQRTIEPVQIYFKARNWYLYAFCQLRQEYRFFKLSRIQDLVPLEQKFSPHEQLGEFVPDAWEDRYQVKLAELVLKFKPCARGRIVEWFPEQNICCAEDGYIYVRIAYPEDEWVYGFILSFGSDVEVLEPLHIQEIIRKRAKEIAAIYNK